jgi:hypothetical protein
MTATQTSPAAWARAAGERHVPVRTAEEAFERRVLAGHGQIRGER